MTDAVATSQDAQQRLFSPLIAFWMIVVGVIAFAGFIVLLAYAPDLRKGDNGGEHAFSKSAVGFAGLVDLLRARGDTPILSQGPLHTSVAAPGLLILTPTEATDSKALAKIKFGGDALIVLPKWETLPDPGHPGWVRKVGVAMPAMVNDVLPEGFHPKDLTLTRQTGVTQPVLKDGSRTLAMGPTDQWQTLSGGANIKAIVTDANGGIVVGLLNPPPPPQNPDDADNAPPPPTVMAPVKPATAIEGQVYVLSDPDLLNTHGLNDLNTTRAALAVIDDLHDSGGPIAFDLTLHGFARGRNALKLAFEPPFLALTLCLLAAALMMGWHAFARFGAAIVPERAVAFGKAALVDNSSALIRVAKREPRMGPRYVNLVRAMVANLVGAPRDLDRADLDKLLDRIGRGKTEQSIESLAEDSANLKNNADLMRLAERLHRWRTEMTRERR